MIDFQRVNWRKQALASPSSWWKSNDEIWAVCPNGHAAWLSEHEIAHSDGAVTPSVVCPEDGCDFHDMVRLVDWSSRDDTR